MSMTKLKESVPVQQLPMKATELVWAAVPTALNAIQLGVLLATVDTSPMEPSAHNVSVTVKFALLSHFAHSAKKSFSL